MSRIKLIWDFRGKDAEEIAKHHAVHLNEFLVKEKLLNSAADFSCLTEMHSIAFVTTDKENMLQLRDALKPNRGEVVNDVE